VAVTKRWGVTAGPAAAAGIVASNSNCDVHHANRLTDTATFQGTIAGLIVDLAEP
jgi:hypothetical protein